MPTYQPTESNTSSDQKPLLSQQPQQGNQQQAPQQQPNGPYYQNNQQTHEAPIGTYLPTQQDPDEQMAMIIMLLGLLVFPLIHLVNCKYRNSPNPSTRMFAFVSMAHLALVVALYLFTMVTSCIGVALWIFALIAVGGAH